MSGGHFLVKTNMTLRYQWWRCRRSGKSHPFSNARTTNRTGDGRSTSFNDGNTGDENARIPTALPHPPRYTTETNKKTPATVGRSDAVKYVVTDAPWRVGFVAVYRTPPPIPTAGRLTRARARREII